MPRVRQLVVGYAGRACSRSTIVLPWLCSLKEIYTRAVFFSCDRFILFFTFVVRGSRPCLKLWRLLAPVAPSGRCAADGTVGADVARAFGPVFALASSWLLFRGSAGHSSADAGHGRQAGPPDSAAYPCF